MRVDLGGWGQALQRLAEAFDIGLRHFAGTAARHIAKDERAIGNAQQAADLQAKMLQHPAHFAVLALGQGHFDPLVAPGAALHIGVDLAVVDPLDGHPLDQLFQLALGDVAKGAGAVGARHAAGG